MNDELLAALIDARVFIAQAAEQGILNSDEVTPILAEYDAVIQRAQAPK